MTTRTTPEIEQEVQDANTCLALGAGLGAFGTGSALLVGATCPICVVLAPALLGVGAVKRVIASRRRRDAAEHHDPDETPPAP